MTAPEVVEFIAYLVTAWSLGFAGGYIITKYKDAMSQCG